MVPLDKNNRYIPVIGVPRATAMPWKSRTIPNALDKLSIPTRSVIMIEVKPT